MSPFAAGAGIPVRSRDVLSVVTHPGGGHDLYRDCRRVAAGLSDAAACAAVIGTLNRAAIEASPWFSVHAGVVSTEGATVAFTGGSGAGKSTLVAACLSRGLRYVSDEALCLDETGGVVAYPKPLALSADSRFLLGLETSPIGGEEMFTAVDLGSRVDESPPPLTDLVMAEFGSTPLEMVEVPQSQGWAELLRLSFNHYRRPRAAFDLAASVARDARVWRLRYFNPLDAADEVGSRLSAR